MPTNVKNILKKIIAKKIQTEQKEWEDFDAKNYMPMRTPQKLPRWLFKSSNTNLQNNKNKTDFSKKQFFIIAECKKASPSKGVFSKHYNPATIAESYQNWGASAISILCEEYFFCGSLAHMQAVRKNCTLPLLLKDFILHEKQLANGLQAGADFALLIAKILSPEKMDALLKFANKLKMSILIEVYDEEDINKINLVLKETAIQKKYPPILLGINNRNLQTFTVDFNRSAQLKKLLPNNYHIISESGIETTQDIIQIKNAGFAGMLVGETLMHYFESGRTAKQLFLS